MTGVPSWGYFEVPSLSAVAGWCSAIISVSFRSRTWSLVPPDTWRWKTKSAASSYTYTILCQMIYYQFYGTIKSNEGERERTISKFSECSCFFKHNWLRTSRWPSTDFNTAREKHGASCETYRGRCSRLQHDSLRQQSSGARLEQGVVGQLLAALQVCVGIHKPAHGPQISFQSKTSKFDQKYFPHNSNKIVFFSTLNVQYRKMSTSGKKTNILLTRGDRVWFGQLQRSRTHAVLLIEPPGTQQKKWYVTLIRKTNCKPGNITTVPLVLHTFTFSQHSDWLWLPSFSLRDVISCILPGYTLLGRVQGHRHFWCDFRK